VAKNKGIAKRRRPLHHLTARMERTVRLLPISQESGMLMLSGSQVAPATIVRAASPDMTIEHTPIRDIFSLSVRAAEVFGSRDKALRWLETPVPSLGDRTPLSLLSTSEGLADVEDTLGAIEHGMW
jgi:putative toxin-antitoxin system antitoxin component (TIGR02293 family)